MANDSAGRIQLDLDLNKQKYEKKIGSVSTYTERIGSKMTSAFKKVGTGASSAFKKVESGASSAFSKMQKKVGDWSKSAVDSFKKTTKEAQNCEKQLDEVSQSADNVSKNTSNASQGNVSGLTSAVKRIGGVIAGAFAVKALVSFGKECVELGSDLSEVQNVVSVTFPQMQKQIDKWSQSAMSSFGLSETVAKKYTGTLGAMAKAFGFSEKEAYDMSTTLAGLAGDVASFYNISQDLAFTKLKAVFSGETEGLKDLGIVMTQSALDAYALSNGFGKTTAQMTEAEKVALRYQFVLNQLSGASGDFARTSDGWANQIRVLQLQFDSLKASIGQLLIHALSPALQFLNAVLGRLVKLAAVIKGLMGIVDGEGGTATATIADTMSDISTGAEDASEATEGVADATEDVGKEAKKTNKETDKTLMGFDAINKINAQNDESGSGSGSTGKALKGAGTGALGATADFGKADGKAKKLDSTLDKLKNRAKELAGYFKKGFTIGFGDSERNIERIQSGLKRIKGSLHDIFSDNQVKQASTDYFNSLAQTAGTVAGSMASIGVSIGTNLVLGFAGYLDGSKQYIKDRITGIFNAKIDYNNIVSDVALMLAEIFGVLTGDNAISCTTALIGIFADGLLGITQLATEFGADVLALITKPFTENSSVIAQAIDGTLKPASEALQAIWQSVKDTCETAISVYDEHVKPMFDAFTQTYTDLTQQFWNDYNTYIVPVLDEAGAKFADVWTTSVQPTIDSFLQMCGKVCDLITVVWKLYISPFLSWVQSSIMPTLAPIFKFVIDSQLYTLQSVADTVGKIIQFVSDLIDKVRGYLEGAGGWSGLWQNAVDFVTSVFSTLASNIRNDINDLISFLNGGLLGVESFVNNVASMINSLNLDIPDWLGGGSISFNLPTWTAPQIPMLADGGYVKANTPRLAVIGDNKTQGEIVAPEGKLAEIMKSANTGITRADMESIMNQSVMRIIAVLAQMGVYLDGRELARLLRPAQGELDYRYNT